jgi:hypothetical protein
MFTDKSISMHEKTVILLESLSEDLISVLLKIMSDSKYSNL